MSFLFIKSNYLYVFLLICLLLQVILLYVMNKSDRRNYSEVYKVYEIYRNFSIDLKEEIHSLDATGKYKFFLLKYSNNRNSNFDITLVSQCSINHIHHIVNLSRTWNGPISVAVLGTAESIDNILWDLARVLYCQKDKNLVLQLVLPAQYIYDVDHNQRLHIIQKIGKSILCNFSNVDITKKKNYVSESPYPVNLLRNIAKAQCHTDFIFTIDIDMIPSAKLKDYFLTFISSKRGLDDKSAYVIPAFEIQGNLQVPRGKNELIEQVKNKICRPFYYIPCRSCQKATQYNRWLLSDTFSGTRVLYEVEWKHPWEPFFIARRQIPNFDERFKQYGMNRVSQICELHVAGYRFQVLDNVFLVHEGFKRVNDFHSTKNAEMEANRKLYERFKEELSFRYPKSKKKC